MRTRILLLCRHFAIFTDNCKIPTLEMEFRFLPRIVFVIMLLNVQTTRCQVVPASDPDLNCNSCCQGSAGINGIPGSAGIPGSNGNNGSPGRDGRDGINGRDGLKGDLGSKGDKGEVGVGERGPLGPEGPTGERGEAGLRGLPGKVGPSGPIGLAGRVGPAGPIGLVGPLGPPGLTGDIGMKGEKGLNGSKGDSGRMRESAFAVYKTGTQTSAASNEIITFDAARVNIGGHFDLNSNRFTCQIAGTYFFSYSAHVIGSNNPDIHLIKDGTSIAHARTTDANVNIQISSSTMLELEIGNQVWLQFVNVAEGIAGGDNQCQFTGFLLYEH
ncbi:uncharacterized protein [Amphiura filiformis]|uniref:uncharacterized protein n=1 Tax=Amphiura filiformis TaxID=82378 RepID=UPI003B220568